MFPNQPLRIEDTDTTDDGWDLSAAEVDIGILVFDLEHRQMLDHLRRLYDSLAKGKPEWQVRQTMSRLLEVSKKHFDHEEDYMKTLAYADYRLHADDHHALGAAFEAFVAELFADGASHDHHLAKVRTFFKKWLLDHILEHDRSMANFLAQKGIR